MTSYKTFVLGLIAAIWVALEPLISNGNFSLQRDWKSLVGAAIIAAFGFVAKDSNVTGGTVSNKLTIKDTVEPGTKDKPEDTAGVDLHPNQNN